MWHAVGTWVSEKWDWLVTVLQFGMVGALGALVAFILHRADKKDASMLLQFIVVGCLIAQFLTSFIARKLGLAVEDFIAFGFLLGSIGGALHIAIMKAISDMDLWAFAKTEVWGFVKEMIRAKLRVNPAAPDRGGEDHE
jgi:Na+/citrate or Na+/malate symporter